MYKLWFSAPLLPCWARGSHSTQGCGWGLLLAFAVWRSLWAGVRMVRGDLREALWRNASSAQVLASHVTVDSCELHRICLLGKVAFLSL